MHGRPRFVLRARRLLTSRRAGGIIFIMDLTSQYPRSPKETVAGYVHVARMIDKARASNAGTLGEYIYNCPMDRAWLEFTGLTAEAFAEAVKSRDDRRMVQWIRENAKLNSADEITTWNQRLLSRTPSSPESQRRFDETRQRIAPNRTDVTTWPDMIDLEEGRSVPKKASSQAGYTYLFAMFVVVVIGVAMMAAAKSWKTEVRREKEAELLFRGEQYRRGIESYYQTARAGFNAYPTELEDLVKDPNSSATKRYMRRLYKDPITNKDFELIKEGNYIKGVRSSSTAVPIKTNGFPWPYELFATAGSYKEWAFIFIPAGKPGGPQPGTTPPAS
jgi:type II secretory pathway pseudopilin PulG